jgi:hypothetical protein
VTWMSFLTLVGGDTLICSWHVVLEGGTVVSVVSPRPTQPPPRAGVRFSCFTVEPSGEQLRQIGALLDAGKIRPVIDRVFPLVAAREAYEAARTSSRQDCAHNRLMPRLVSVNVGVPKDVPWQGRTVRTAIWNEPVEGRRTVRRINIAVERGEGCTTQVGYRRAVRRRARPAASAASPCSNCLASAMCGSSSRTVADSGKSAGSSSANVVRQDTA